MGVNKVIYGTQTIIDLTADTVNANVLLSGYTAHGANGNLIRGTFSPFGAVTPYKFDYHDGYFSGSVWKYYSTDYKYCSDIYQVQKDKIYFITLGNTVGSQFLSGFVTNDVSANHANAVAEIINDPGGGQRFSNFMFMPEQNGYLIILKDEAFVTGIKTYLYDVTNTWI